MVIIKGLENVPKIVKHREWNGHEYGCYCPCYQEATMDGPPCCTILALVRNDSLDADPDIYGCPLERVSDS